MYLHADWSSTPDTFSQVMSKFEWNETQKEYPDGLLQAANGRTYRLVARRAAGNFFVVTLVPV